MPKACVCTECVNWNLPILNSIFPVHQENISISSTLRSRTSYMYLYIYFSSLIRSTPPPPLFSLILLPWSLIALLSSVKVAIYHSRYQLNLNFLSPLSIWYYSCWASVILWPESGSYLILWSSYDFLYRVS